MQQDPLPPGPALRRCVSCRTLAPKSQFWRIVRLAGTHEIKLDEGMGRSAYICRHPRCLQEAQKKNRLSRSLRSPVSPQTYEILLQRLEQERSSVP